MADPKTILLWTSALIGVGTVIAGVIRFLFYLYDEIKKRSSLKSRGSTCPADGLRIALKPGVAYWWHMGAYGTRPVMQVVGDFLVTNITEVPLRLPQIQLRYGLLGRKRLLGEISVQGPDRYHGMYDIGPNETRDSRASFWVLPPVRKEGDPFAVHSILFYDQFGNAYPMKKLRFAYL